MTIDHDTFDERIADLADLDDLPADLAEHATLCTRCQARLDLARRIRAVAPDLVEPVGDVDTITEVVLARTQTRSKIMPKLLAVAAAGIVIVAGITITVTNSDDQSDVLAQIADDYANSDSIRFVYATEASINVADEFNLKPDASTDVQALSVKIPTCAGDTTVSDDGVLDLAPIADALASNDPCLALQLIDESATPARETYAALAASIEAGNNNIENLTTARPETELAEAAVDDYISGQLADIAQAQQALNDLEQTFTTLAVTVEPLTDTATSGTVSTVTIESELKALRADTTTAEQNFVASDPVVTWTQIATGTWTPNSIAISGVTERQNASKSYDTVDDDPLALADIVLATPDTLIALLRSAPESDNDLVVWEVPVGALDGTEAWMATARLDNGQLVEIKLESTTSTITFTPRN